jgi:hypothetical protein
MFVFDFVFNSSNFRVHLNIYIYMLKETKAVPLHATEALGGEDV